MTNILTVEPRMFFPGLETARETKDVYSCLWLCMGFVLIYGA